MPSVKLTMLGAMEAKDEEILADMQRNYVRGDADIHLLSDPTIINHEAVNEDLAPVLLIAGRDRDSFPAAQHSR
jgi:hypothetical protein